MEERKKEFSTSVADEVEKSVKEKSAKAENFVRKALDSFEELIYQLMAIRPKDFTPKDLKKNPMKVTVRFISEMITCIKNSKEEVISGSLNQVQTITDTWTFAKNKNAQTPTYT